jgi:hypothetical protein
LSIIRQLQEIRYRENQKSNRNPIQVYLTRQQTVCLIKEISPLYSIELNIESDQSQIATALDPEQKKPYFVGNCLGIDVYNICDTEIYCLKPPFDENDSCAQL